MEIFRFAAMTFGAWLLVSVSVHSVAENCEQALQPAKTLGQIMHFYVEHLNATEAFVARASSDPAAVTAAEINDATAHAATVRYYAEQAVAHARADMPPLKIHRMDEYVAASEKFVEHMIAYHDLIRELLNPSAHRQDVLIELRSLERKYNNFSARAHARF